MKLRLTFPGVRMTVIGELSFRREMLRVITNDYKRVSQGSGSAVPTFKPMLSHTPAYHTHS